MSEYLWDKTGEDEEVERLEGLLSEFRHRPRPLELPAEARGREVVPSRAPRVFRPAWLAVAAALLLAVLAGALFVIRRGAPVGGGRGEQKQTASEGSQKTPRQDASRQTPSPVAEPGKGETTPRENEVVQRGERNGPDVRDQQTVKAELTLKDERSARQAVSGKPEGLQAVGGVAPKRRGGVTSVALNPKERDREAAAVPPRVTPASAPLEERRQAAKDDLMYALRLTGLKLKEVQRKTQKVDGWKSAFDEQKPK
jgi:hypothetical protein